MLVLCMIFAIGLVPFATNHGRHSRVENVYHDTTTCVVLISRTYYCVMLCLFCIALRYLQYFPYVPNSALNTKCGGVVNHVRWFLILLFCFLPVMHSVCKLIKKGRPLK